METLYPVYNHTYPISESIITENIIPVAYMVKHQHEKSTHKNMLHRQLYINSGVVEHQGKFTDLACHTIFVL